MACLVLSKIGVHSIFLCDNTAYRMCFGTNLLETKIDWHCWRTRYEGLYTQSTRKSKIIPACISLNIKFFEKKRFK